MRYLLLLSLGVVGCGNSPATPDAAFCTTVAPAPTFANVQIVFEQCTTCHTNGVPLDLAPTVAYANLVGVVAHDYTDPATADSCGGLLVDPGKPDTSYLLQKLSTPAPCAGSQMPLTELGGSAPLDTCEQTLVHDWIAAGALDD
jgi:hypothetical protein